MVDKGRITQQQSDKLFEIFERGYNNNEQKRINRLEKGLNDEENINRIVASSNLKLKTQFKRKGKEYEQELIKKKREELAQLYKEDIEHTNIDEEDIDENYNVNMRHFEFKNNIFNSNSQINDFIKNNIDLLKVDKPDKYLFKSIISNLFINTPQYVIYDTLPYNSPATNVAIKQIVYLINKYTKSGNKTDENIFNSIKAYLFNDFIKYYKTINNDIDRPKYLSYFNNLLDLINSDVLEDLLMGWEGTSDKSAMDDIKLMPEIVKLKSIISSLDIKRLSINNIIELAQQWNKIFNSNQDFKKIWTYMGMSKYDTGGKTKGNLLWQKVFERNPFYSKKHKLFAIEGIKEMVDRKTRIANYDDLRKTFIERNQVVFDDKGETLTVKEAKIMFDRIINALEQGEKETQQEQQSLSSKEKYKKGSGISKRKILKYLKGKTKVSKPSISGLDTEIFKILNS